jgi:3-(3-hydroxy-phenyl)propionate hydroxylase
MSTQTVLIAGGGPVGLFCALLLGRQGINVRVFDVNATLQADPRAATTHPATLDILAQAGVVDDMITRGLVAPTFQFWDRPTNTKVAEFDHSILKNDTAYPFVVQCEQFKTAQIIMERLSKLPNVEILFNHEVFSVEQNAHEVKVGVRTHKGETSFTGSYLIGCDGGRSTIRKQCEIPFEGFTWAERFLVLTTPFDFEKELGYCYRSYFADPDEWCNCFKVAADGPPGLWRLVFPADATVPEADVLSDQAVHQRMQKFFPSSTPYNIVHRNLYTIHQRVASTFRKGRVMLAGDSAHVNNSIGGMGLNGGLQDAANISEKLADVILNGASDAMLDLYSLQRRTVSIEFVQQQSIANKKRLEAKDPEQRKKNFEELAAIASDKERAHDFMLRQSMIAMQRRAHSIGLEEVHA